MDTPRFARASVVKAFTKEEIFGDNIPENLKDFETPCKRHKPGQEFVSTGERCPEGFCAWAFNDIYRDIIHLMKKGDYPG